MNRIVDRVFTRTVINSNGGQWSESTTRSVVRLIATRIGKTHKTTYTQWDPVLLKLSALSLTLAALEYIYFFFNKY